MSQSRDTEVDRQTAVPASRSVSWRNKAHFKFVESDWFQLLVGLKLSNQNVHMYICIYYVVYVF